MNIMKMKSPLGWYGGKYYMANDIIALFPEHKIYVEGFGGAAHILFRKPKSNIEIYNDIHQGVYLLFKLLRDETKRDLLIEKIQLTPYSRQEFYNCRGAWENEEDEIEKVRKFYTATMQSVAATGTGGWCYSKTTSRRGMCQTTSRWLGNVDENLVDAIERLREVQIENLDIIDLLDKYDNELTFFYLDPPYISETRNVKNVYHHEMDINKHIEMIDKLKTIKGKVILSGYEHPLYNDLIDAGWHKKILGKYNKFSQIGKGSKFDKGIEIIWKNFK